jgi:hypothetical protein
MERGAGAAGARAEKHVRRCRDIARVVLAAAAKASLAAAAAASAHPPPTLLSLQNNNRRKNNTRFDNMSQLRVYTFVKGESPGTKDMKELVS